MSQYAVTKDTLERVESNQKTFDQLVDLIGRLPTPADRVALVAALSHFLITSEAGEYAFNEVLDGLLFVVKPDAATRVMITAKHLKA